MSLPHFFLEAQCVADMVDRVFPLDLNDDDAAHARVLRLQPGEHIAVVDSARDYFECEIVDFDDALNVRICGRLRDESAGPSIVLAQGLSKGDRMDDVFRHGTEIGVGAFLPFACRRSVVKLDERKVAGRMKRWRSIVRSAAVQSGRTRIPTVDEPTSIDGLASGLADAACVLVCWEQADTLGIDAALQRARDRVGDFDDDARIAVIIGPEGGLCDDEVETLLACNPCSYPVSLGTAILRTETAGIIAPALVSYSLGGLR